MHSQLKWLLTSKYYDDYLKELKAGHYFASTTSLSVTDLLDWSKCTYADWPLIDRQVPHRDDEDPIRTKEVLSKLLPPDKYPEHYL